MSMSMSTTKATTKLPTSNRAPHDPEMTRLLSRGALRTRLAAHRKAGTIDAADFQAGVRELEAPRRLPDDPAAVRPVVDAWVQGRVRWKAQRHSAGRPTPDQILGRYEAFVRGVAAKLGVPYPPPAGTPSRQRARPRPADVAAGRMSHFETRIGPGEIERKVIVPDWMAKRR